MGVTRVKICGITRAEDAQAAVAAGADAIGLVFYPPSPRYVTPEQATEIIHGLPPFVTRVGLFVNHSAQQVADICDQVDLDLLQFHGDESPELCASLGKRYLKAVRMAPDCSVSDWADQFQGAAGLLLDSFDPNQYGGSGQTFDWQRIPANLELPIVLAGGLNSSNIVSALEIATPYAVDVSSGVETAPGVKSAAKIRQFINLVKRVETATK
ncbi:MAG: phosphoribosylanthranilate isomerase [Immundisolibacteraceae bacterium]|nr:phosphoribosylanthranilate isomerase [Immundisolibacteraceae bacterium]